jgi:hypothetical protein
VKRRLAVLTAACAVAAVAALPAATASAQTSAPPPYCLHTVWGTFCTYDVGPLITKIKNDPVGYLCNNPAISCGRTS